MDNCEESSAHLLNEKKIGPLCKVHNLLSESSSKKTKSFIQVETFRKWLHSEWIYNGPITKEAYTQKDFRKFVLIECLFANKEITVFTLNIR